MVEIHKHPLDFLKTTRIFLVPIVAKQTIRLYPIIVVYSFVSTSIHLFLLRYLISKFLFFIPMKHIPTITIHSFWSLQTSKFIT